MIIYKRVCDWFSQFQYKQRRLFIRFSDRVWDSRKSASNFGQELPTFSSLLRLHAANSKRDQAFTLVELLVVVSIIAILVALVVPNVTGALKRGQMTQTLNNARQLTLAVQQMSIDSFAAGGGPSWTTRDGVTHYGSIGEFMNAVVEHTSLSASDIKKLISAPGVKPINLINNQLPAEISQDQCAFIIFQTTEGSPNERVFLATKNWSDSGGGVITSAAPYGESGFVVFRKGGDGAICTRQSDASDLQTVFGVNAMEELRPLK